MRLQFAHPLFLRLASTLSAVRLFSLDRLDRYLLHLIAAPLALVLATLLLSQLLERLLRLFDLAASAGAPIASVAAMFFNLVPHYLGLALPMAFTAAIFIVIARLADDSELDVMLSNGRSIGRIVAPFVMLALLLVPLDLYLHAQLQPLTRYAYRAAVHAALQTGWDAKLQANRFIAAGGGTTFRAGSIDADGRGLGGVFVAHRQGGVEEVTTARRGELIPPADGSGLRLRLDDGMTFSEHADTTVSVSRFVRADVDHDLSPTREAFRDRGESVREQTLGELWREMRTLGSPKAAAEFHGRLARVSILPLLPLLTLPLGMAAKRGRRLPGVVFATLALVLLQHALQFGQGLAENGRLPAAPAVWVPFAAFAALTVWIFRGSLAWPGDNPVTRAVARAEALVDGVLPWRRRAAQAAVAGAPGAAPAP